MQRRRTFTVMAILLAVLVLGVGYAAVANVNLDLNGTGNINANFDFTVVYDTTSTIVVSPDATTTTDDNQTHPIVAGAYTDTENATMTVWLDKDNTSASAVYTVKNTSSALSARLSTSVTNVSGASADYFSDITAVYYADSACTDPLGTDLLPANQKAYLKVTVSMAKAPLADVTNATFSVATTAEPAEAD